MIEGAAASALVVAGAMMWPGAPALQPDVGAWIEVQSTDRVPARRRKPANTIADVFGAMGACWRGPPATLARPGTEIVIRFSFRRDGTMIGAPHLTFQTELTPEQRRAYFTAVSEALDRCLPLPLTAALADAIAGHPFVFRFVDDRNQRKAEYRP